MREVRGGREHHAGTPQRGQSAGGRGAFRAVHPAHVEWRYPSLGRRPLQKRQLDLEGMVAHALFGDGWKSAEAGVDGNFARPRPPTRPDAERRAAPRVRAPAARLRGMPPRPRFPNRPARHVARRSPARPETGTARAGANARTDSPADCATRRRPPDTRSR